MKPPPSAPSQANPPSAPERHPLAMFEDRIGEQLREAQASGELQRSRSWGKPLDFGDGYDDTPRELRMAMKVLKDAGIVPPEVEALHRLAALREQAAAATDEASRRRLAQQASELEQLIRLRLERLARGSF